MHIFIILFLIYVNTQKKKKMKNLFIIYNFFYYNLSFEEYKKNAFLINKNIRNYYIILLLRSRIFHEHYYYMKN